MEHTPNIGTLITLCRSIYPLPNFFVDLQPSRRPDLSYPLLFCSLTCSQAAGLLRRLQIVRVDWHSRIEQDWYAATFAADLLAFIYVICFYQARKLPMLIIVWLQDQIYATQLVVRYVFSVSVLRRHNPLQYIDRRWMEIASLRWNIHVHSVHVSSTAPLIHLCNLAMLE